LDNDGARERLGEAWARLQSQLADIAALEEKQAALRANGRAADGVVEVTVDARGQLVEVVIDEDYLRDHKLAELGEHITEAARMAAADAGRRVAQLMAPLTERFGSFSSLSEKIRGAGDLEDLLSGGWDSFARAASPAQDLPGAKADGDGDPGDGTEFVKVRRD
jgi:DNA-binding protein YbaB